MTDDHTLRSMVTLLVKGQAPDMGPLFASLIAAHTVNLPVTQAVASAKHLQMVSTLLCFCQDQGVSTRIFALHDAKSSVYHDDTYQDCTSDEFCAASWHVSGVAAAHLIPSVELQCTHD